MRKSVKITGTRCFLFCEVLMQVFFMMKETLSFPFTWEKRVRTAYKQVPAHVMSVFIG